MSPNPMRVGRAKRSLGQNFLVDPNLQRKIVAELEAGPDHAVLEIGPGHGELTTHLAGRVRRLVLVEKDRDLVAGLRERWPAEVSTPTAGAGVTVIEADALDIDLSSLAADESDLLVLSNVPYNVTSPLLFAFLGMNPRPRRVVVTIQREVAERIVARPGGKSYGALSVGVQSVATAELRFGVARTAFRPVPDVDSATVRLDPYRPGPGHEELGQLRDLTRILFSRRRKQLQKTLRTAPELGFTRDPVAFLRGLGIDPAARPETLSPAELMIVARALASG